VVTCLEQGANDFHMVQLMALPSSHLFDKIRNGFTFLMLAYPDCPPKTGIIQAFVVLQEKYLTWYLNTI